MGAICNYSNVVASKLHIVSGLKEGWSKCHKTPVFSHDHPAPYSKWEGLKFLENNLLGIVLFWRGVSYVGCQFSQGGVRDFFLGGGD